MEMSFSTDERSALFRSARVDPWSLPRGVSFPALNRVSTYWIRMVVLNTPQHARGVVIKQLCVHFLPPIGQSPTTHQKWLESISTVLQVLEGSDRGITRVTI